jgi:DNA primase small subunit
MSIDSQAYIVYYKRLLPFKSLFTWLNHQHAPTRLFTHREWAFTVAGDVYLRWNSFNTVDEFKKEVLRLNPSRFEIGAVYTGRVGLPTPRGRSYADQCHYFVMFYNIL